MSIKKRYDISFTNSAFNREKQEQNISSTKRQYTKLIADMNKNVEELDRFDDFDSLQINPRRYKKDKDSEYGIVPRVPDVIYPHQQKAALGFLKELRGFGLLADVVGSGKTFEAGVVISELAFRNKLRSMLFVVPTQVINAWKDVIENKFGLGKGKLLDLSAKGPRNKDGSADGYSVKFSDIECNDDTGFMIPVRPIIVAMEDFVKWDDGLAKLLFDVIVVDEAHHLCSEEGVYAKAMRLLSLMMETKKKANVTYLLLLSATPHSGNLDHMFRLWYFIRCIGGNPSDFEEKEDKDRTYAYVTEKRYYKTVVCKNSNTVMDFVKKVKLSEVELNFSKEFTKYLSDKGKTLSKLSNVEKAKEVAEFLFDNVEIYENVKKRVASAYHNGLLRSIMIRQPAENMVGQSKKIINYLFFPTNKVLGNIKVEGFNEKAFELDLSNISSSKAVTFENQKYSLEEYIKENKGDHSYQKAYADLMVRNVLNTLDNMEDNEYFEKANSTKFYLEQLSNFPDLNKVTTNIVPVNYDKEHKLAHKITVLKKILHDNPDSRIIIFFDYGEKKRKLQSKVADVEQSLRADAELAKRLVVGQVNNKDKAIEEYDDKEGAILLATDVAYTESANLQKGNIIINFQVTPDPLSMDQRIGRVFRLGQENNVTIYSLADMHKLEGYVLMYFTRIGLLTSNSGDATIIAGSNNEEMVTVQCERCGKVMLLDKEEYEELKKKDELYCRETQECVTYNPKGTKMNEMAVFDFKCDTCGSIFARSADGGYNCISTNNDAKGVMCNDGESGVANRKYYCRKICSIAHCSFFTSSLMKGKCPALEAYKKNKNIDDIDLMALCDDCTNPNCLERCRVGSGINSIKHCMECDYADICHPRQGIITFNEHWEAECPRCKSERKLGKLKKITARTFESYIRGSWNFTQDRGRTFCNNLLKEASKVAEIKTILEMDNLDDRK